MSCLTAISKINIKLFNRICIVLFFTVVLTSSLFLSNYCLNKSPYKFDALYIQNNKEIADNLKKEYTTENSIYICDNVVRGYFTQLFERNVYEHIKYEDAINIAYAKNKRYVVYIETNLHPWQLSEIKDVKIIDTDEVVQDYSKFFLTDENWERGYSVKFAGFYIPNTTTNREKFKVSNKILLDNGEEREIIEVIENGQYVHVKVEGDLFTCEPYPIDLEIVE